MERLESLNLLMYGLEDSAAVKNPEIFGTYAHHFLSTFKNLAHLKISNLGLCQRTLGDLGYLFLSLPKLQSLRIEFRDIDLPFPPPFDYEEYFAGSLMNLKDLQSFHLNIAVSARFNLRIRRFNIRRVLTSLMQLSKLIDLSLTGVPLTYEEVAEDLSNLLEKRQLRKLGISKTTVIEKILKSVRTFGSVKEFLLESDPMDVVQLMFADYGPDFPIPESLYLRGTCKRLHHQFTANIQSVKHFSLLSRKNTVDRWSNAELLSSLLQGLVGSESVRSIQIEISNDRHIALLNQIFQTCPSLEDLDIFVVYICPTPLSTRSVCQLFGAISESRLKNLRISSNSARPGTLRALCDAFSVNKTLKTFSFIISDFREVVYIIESLSGCPNSKIRSVSFTQSSWNEKPQGEVISIINGNWKMRVAVIDKKVPAMKPLYDAWCNGNTRIVAAVFREDCDVLAKQQVSKYKDLEIKLVDGEWWIWKTA
ncbi:hypothetical protein HK098_008250 [Nowakowskiella sp. JEL0407]|nr:hypothetical protein HK098_008250 [Nowakowskiella sp. JEL0407]